MSTSKILSYELAPSPATIFGCLLPAPWLGVAAGLLLAFGPSVGVPDRFSPLVLAVTHVLLLGMLAPVMVGALFQLLPVVAGQVVPAAKWISPFVAVGSGGTALALSLGFLRGDHMAFVWAACSAILLFGAVVGALAHAGWRMALPPHADASLTTLRWISIPLSMVIALGVALAGGFAGWWSLNFSAILKLHVAWGSIGWIAALVLGIASTVVPMFWQTPKPKRSWHRFLPWSLWFLLAAISLFEYADIWPYFSAMLSLLVMLLAGLALKFLLMAKRRFDPAWILWITCACSWFASAALYFLSCFITHKFPAWIAGSLPWWIGVFALVGGAVFPVNAMLGKIVPFLVFLHLRRQIPVPKRIPTMQEVISPSHLRWQARSLLLALCLLLLLPVAQRFFLPFAGCAFAFSQMLIGCLLLRALFRYRHELKSALFS